MNKLKDFLNIRCKGKFSKGTIWHVIDDEITTYPCMDISLATNKSKNDEDICFHGDMAVIKLFDTGDPTYYPAIWIGNDSLKSIEEQPIYILDYDDFVEGYELKPVGNFRSYVEKILNDFLEQYFSSIEDEYIKTAEIMLNKLKDFSQNVIDKGNYKPVLL